MKRFLILGTLACVLFCPATSSAEDWGACHQALKEMRVASRRASFETLETHRKEKQLTDCLAVKYYHGRCPAIEKDLQFQRERMRSALASTQAAIFQVELSCRQFLPLGREGSPKGDHYELWLGMCAKLKSTTKGMSPAARIDFCQKLHFPGDCSQCLAPPSNAGDTKPGE